ncbi:MAG: DUF1566 domain-containing protein [Methylococcaceae bacterium]
MKITLKTLLTFGLLFAIISNSQATEITNTSATGTTFKFSATLDAPLTTGNKVKIDFGKGGLKAMTCSAKNCTLSSNALPSGISTATYKIGIYNASNVLQGSTSDGTYVISSSSSATVSTTDSSTTDYSKTTGYTKIANNSSTVSDSAKLGTNPTDWACTQDNKTGLIWEVKTTDGGLRDMSNYYSWYEPDARKNGGFAGYQNLGSCNGSDCDIYAFKNAVNIQGLCGATDWRVPTKEELLSIVKSGATYPSIDTTYFPNTKRSWFWSSSFSAGFSSYAWGVGFDSGFSGGNSESFNGRVRLVRG